MMKHQAHLPRPMTEIERIFREVEPQAPEELPAPVQVPGFRNPNDPRIPASIHRAAVEKAQKGKRR